MTSLESLPLPISVDAAEPIPFNNTYARLPEAFYQRVKPATAAAPALLRVNDALARQLRIDPEFLKSPEGVAILSGNDIAPARSQSRKPMQDTSSGTSCPSWATAAPSCLVKSWTLRANDTTFSSKDLAEPAFHGAAMAAPRSALSSANTLSARPWPRLAFRRRARSPRC